MSDVCGDTLGNRPSGYPCFLLARHTLGMRPVGSPLLFKHFPKCIRYSVKVLKRSPILFVHFPKSRQYSSDTSQTVSTSFKTHFPASLCIIWAFPLHFPQNSAFLLIKIKNQRLNRKFIRTISGSSTDYFLSNHTTFCQTQADATAPLSSWLTLYIHNLY